MRNSVAVTQQFGEFAICRRFFLGSCSVWLLFLFLVISHQFQQNWLYLISYDLRVFQIMSVWGFLVVVFCCCLVLVFGFGFGFSLVLVLVLVLVLTEYNILVFWSYFQNQNFTSWEINWSGGRLHCELSNSRNRSIGSSSKIECSFSTKCLYFSTCNPHAYCFPEKQSCLFVRLLDSGRKMYNSEP